MAYAAKADLLKYLSETKLIQLTSETDTEDDTVITQALNDASAEIDRYVGKRYQVPLVDIPDAVKAACAHIAIYWLYTRREEVFQTGVPEARMKAYESQISWLKMVARGEATLGEIPEEQAVSAATTPEYEAETRVMTRDDLGGW